MWLWMDLELVPEKRQLWLWIDDLDRVGQKYILVFLEYVGKINTKNTKKKYKNTKSAVTCSKTVF